MGFLDSKIKVLPNGREVLQMQDSVNFAFVTKDDYLILASQFRACNGQESLNLFGGYIEEGEGQLSAIEREAKEEANIDKEDMCGHDFIIVDKYVSMGYTTERNHTCIILLNKNLKDLDLKCNDEDENIKIVSTKITKDNIEKIACNTDGLKLYLVCQHMLDSKNIYLW